MFDFPMEGFSDAALFLATKALFNTCSDVNAMSLVSVTFDSRSSSSTRKNSKCPSVSHFGGFLRLVLTPEARLVYPDRLRFAPSFPELLLPYLRAGLDFVLSFDFKTGLFLEGTANE